MSLLPLPPLFRSRTVTKTKYEDLVLVANTQVLRDRRVCFSYDNFAFSAYAWDKKCRDIDFKF